MVTATRPKRSKCRMIVKEMVSEEYGQLYNRVSEPKTSKLLKIELRKR